MNILKILFDEQGTTLAITRVSSGAVATAAIQSTRDAQVEAVVNGNIDSDANIAADGVKAVALNSDCAGSGIKQEAGGALAVDLSDTNPSLEVSDGGLRAKVAEVINRTSDGLTWGRTGDVIFSSSTSTPTGFTDISTTYANKMVRIGTTALSEGGSDTLSGNTGSTTLTGAQSGLPAHTVTVPGKSGGAVGTTANFTRADTAPSDGNIDVSVSSASASSGHTHDLTSVSCLNAYVSLKVYQKN